MYPYASASAGRVWVGRMVRLLSFPWKASVVKITLLNKESEYKISKVALPMIKF
jgi:hypothetical protein